MEVEENSLDEWRRWFQCPACDRMVTGLVQKGHPHPEKGHAVYSHSHCCQSCERGGPHGEKWLCAGVPAALFQSVELNTTGVQQLQHYLLHDPGGPLRPVLLFLHGANTYIYPETLWWDLIGLVSNNQTLRENFIIIAPFGSVGEPVVHPSSWNKADRFYNQIPYVKCFDPEILWDFFISALRALDEGLDCDEGGPRRFDPARLHVTGYSMGGQATWGLANLFGSRLASAAPMAARCAWEDDAWNQQESIIGEMLRLPLWSYAGKADTRAVSWRDLWWLADERGHETKAFESVISTENGVKATVHTWSPNLSVSLLEGTPTDHCIWDSVFHNEAAFGLFSRMLQSSCESPPSIDVTEARFPAKKNARLRVCGFRTKKRKYSSSLVEVKECPNIFCRTL